MISYSFWSPFSVFLFRSSKTGFASPEGSPFDFLKIAFNKIYDIKHYIHVQTFVPSAGADLGQSRLVSC